MTAPVEGSVVLAGSKASFVIFSTAPSAYTIIVVYDRSRLVITLILVMMTPFFWRFSE